MSIGKIFGYAAAGTMITGAIIGSTSMMWIGLAAAAARIAYLEVVKHSLPQPVSPAKVRRRHITTDRTS